MLNQILWMPSYTWVYQDSRFLSIYEMKIMFKLTFTNEDNLKHYNKWAPMIKNKYLLVRRNPNARDILMIFLQIQRSYILWIKMFHIKTLSTALLISRIIRFLPVSKLNFDLSNNILTIVLSSIFAFLRPNLWFALALRLFLDLVGKRH